MQFSLRALFHAFCLFSAASVAASGALAGQPGRIAFPFLLLGAAYTSIVAYRLRRTVVRFPWETAKFLVCWCFVTVYVAGAVLCAASRISAGYPSAAAAIADALLLGASPMALWAVYCLVDVYRRAKLYPDDDFA